MSSAKPSLELLRSLTDEHVLRAVMEAQRITRTQIASRTGISKPTVSDSVRRLSEAGVLVDTGERTTGRGRAGSYYSLSEDCGAVLVASITPSGVVAEAVDAFGRVVAREQEPIGRAPGAEVAADVLAQVAARVQRAGHGPLRCAVVSAADPVDRETGRLVQLPDVPFLVGDLDPVAVVDPLVDGPVLVDNDVNWAARAEQGQGCAAGVDDFVYVYLDEGLGCAVVTDGSVRRGHRGFAGEIAHLHTEGPGGTAVPLIEVFAALGLRRRGTTAVDVEALHEAIADDGATGEEVRRALSRAVHGVLAAAVALADPELIVLGGSWGADPTMVRSLDEQFAEAPRHVPVVPAGLTEPEIAGARAHGVEELRNHIIASPR
ncbi:ROK family transcriptional regulator [Saccharopolyspora rhizosphaerae]|uniref:ROK family transcriptional regulator n=1 Tax=Saccharopolyspora rhizosphaerae TaxID=2492662 RepID=A0A3R8P5L2_9PSEU|nr:ROK family transcriptional regulator [Saccharopolyspora rhizosphaerae]RRO17016.1 ROK family transcriptional regulator [Saccharopolyspora rhizosphaerae]